MTRNHRGLEGEVEKDSEGKITSKRQRGNTQVMQKLSCGWRGVVSHRFPHACAADRIRILTMTCGSHTHAMENPFACQVHVKGTVEYQMLTANARNMRRAMISYSDSQRVLQMEGLGLPSILPLTATLSDITDLLPDYPEPFGCVGGCQLLWRSWGRVRGRSCGQCD